MKILTVLAMSAALALGATAPALADPMPRANLKIVIAPQGAPTQSVTLTCGPAGGTHPTPRAACRVLRQVHGDPSKLTSDGAVCTKEYQPHTVAVIGRWHGRRIAYLTMFNNACLMRAAGKELYTL